MPVKLSTAKKHEKKTYGLSRWTDGQKWTSDRFFVHLDAGIRRKKRKYVYLTSNGLIALRRRKIEQIIGSVSLR
jgi:hypothetical protein